MAQTPVIREASSDVLDYIASADKTAGEVVLVGTIPMVVVRDIDVSENTLGGLASGEGETWLMPQAAEVLTGGDAVYWDADGNPYGGTAGSGCATGTATGNNLIGTVAPLQRNGTEATAATDSYVRVLPNAANRTTTIAGSVTADDITGSDTSLAIAGAPAANATAAGGAVAIAGAAGGATSGTGGAVSVAGGAGTNGNANGGAVSLVGGAKNGSGADGAIAIGATNTASVTLGAVSIPTKVVGPMLHTIGATKAAAGSTVADATELPAGTASVYPTTAADDATGVKLHASDKVDGRMIFIGNGVANKILKVYGPSGAAINGAAADAAFSSVSGKGVIMYCLSASGNTWLAW